MNPVPQCRHQIRTAEPILATLDDAHRAMQPTPGGKTAGWLIGHLAVTGDFGRRLCGRKAICPAEWRAKFNPGTQPSANAADYPPMAELLSHFRAVYADLQEAFPAANAEALGAVNPYEPGRAAFPTAGEFVAYMMTGHLGYHLGQLHGWRAAAGLGASGGEG
jgi:hypothetical protein